MGHAIRKFDPPTIDSQKNSIFFNLTIFKTKQTQFFLCVFHHPLKRNQQNPPGKSSTPKTHPTSSAASKHLKDSTAATAASLPAARIHAALPKLAKSWAVPHLNEKGHWFFGVRGETYPFVIRVFLHPIVGIPIKHGVKVILPFVIRVYYIPS